ncbi:MAG: ABC transporter permease [Bryobacteraceae bacterium]
MTAAARLRSWLRSVTSRSRVEAEMDAELRFHIDAYAEDLVRSGVSRNEALRRARVEFGGVEMQKEECRASLGLRLWDELQSDLRYGWRSLGHSRVFTAVAVLSLALGIGANTAIFTLAKEVLLKTMAVPHSERLRLFTWIAKPRIQNFGGAWGSFDRNSAGDMVGTPFPYPLFIEMRRHNEVLGDLVAFKDLYKLTATIDGQAEAVDGMLVSGNFYQTLGAQVIAGRGITPEDDSVSANPVAVISDAYWARRFGRSASALGKAINLNRVPITIVGVNSPQFNGAKAGGTPEIFFPISLQPQVIPRPKGSLLTSNSFWWLMVMGRLKPGVSQEAAQAALDVSFRNAFHATLPDKKDSDMPRFELVAGSRGLDLRKGEFKKPIYVLLSVAGLVLLIACANLANLLLARSATRQREMSVRLAMGAGRYRIVRQVFTESMLLAFLGGTAGLLLGYMGRNIIPNLFGDSWRARSFEADFDWRVFAFAFAITVVTGLLFGVAPAWHSTRTDVNAGLKETGRATAGRPKALLGKSLVVLQVSHSLLLLIGAGLFLRTLVNLKSAAIGFNPEHILLFQLDPPRAHYPSQQRVALFRRIEEKVSTLPGVQAATVSSDPLLAQSLDNGCFAPSDKPAGSRPRPVLTNNVGARFFETFGIPIVEGRGFSVHDTATAPKVAIVNRQLASKFFGQTNPIGRTISDCDSDSAAATPIAIVGVAADAKYDNLRDAAPPTLYLPYTQLDDADSMTFEIRTAASTASIVAELRDAVRSVDKDLPLLEVRTQTQQIDAILTEERVFATLTTGFGLVALILASIGIYGIMAYTVSRRTNEIGIRMALGAQAPEVLTMVLGETSLLTCIGIGVGLALAIGMTRVLASMLYGLKPTDIATFTSAALLLLVIALIAGLAPARRAAGVDPMRALRHE